MAIVINKRQRIMTALITALAAIRKTGGYELNLSTAQVREWETYDAKDLLSTFDGETIIIALRDSTEQYDMATNQDEHILIVELDAYILGKEAVTIFRKFAADLITFIRNTRSTALSGLIETIDLAENDNTIIYQDKRKLAVYKRNIYITYVTENYNAYN